MSEVYVQVFQEYRQIPGCTNWLRRTVDFKTVELCAVDDLRGIEIMSEVAQKALPGHTLTVHKLTHWGWYEIDDTDETIVNWWAD